jgi:cytochrome c-type biogenesis protein CcmH/NrfG
VFELGRPQDAVPQLERLLSIQPSNIDAMFVLARAYFMTERYREAIELYDKIISRTRDRRVQAEALNNIDIIQGVYYE